MTATADSPSRQSLFRRPTAETGFWSWFTTVDHKKIGIMYFCASMLFFVIGGINALLLRAQLALPEGNVIDPDLYSQLFTMHGLTMIFFAVMPLGAAFFNYFLPLMVGARDVAYPRFNAFSFHVFFAAGLFMYSSIFFGGMPDGGWFGYAPLSIITGDSLGDTIGNADLRMIFYSLGLQVAGISTLAASINFIVTILNMRAPGMTMLRLPVFVWMTFVISVLALFALPIIGVALWALLLDGLYGTHFFTPAEGGDPMLWQHLFWLFGHPEVYILILPSFGIVAEIIPTFSRKPLFAYGAFVFSGLLIGLLSWGVWGHHMLASDLGDVADTGFSVTTMFISIPTGVMVFCWLATLWRGQIRFATPMLFALGMVAMFTIGGLSGVTHAEPAHNMQQHDTYYVAAHLHYVLFGGAIFGLMAGVYYWFPKVTGRMMSERLGKFHFWLTFIGFNVTFGPFHILGLWGMPRRQPAYPDGLGWNFWNLVASIGAAVIALSVLLFIINIIVSRRSGIPAGHDPWDARTLEWQTRSPTPPHNFDFVPHVSARDEFWHRKYGPEGHGPRLDPPPGPPAPGEASEEERFAAARAATAISEHDGPFRDPKSIELPAPSYYPLVVGASLFVLPYGFIVHPVLLAVGGVLLLWGSFGWAMEPSVEGAHGAQHEEHH